MTEPTQAVADRIWYDADEYGDVVRRLRADGSEIVEFDGGDSVESLFQEFKARLPLDPPISGRVHWDAFSDSLWSGLNDLDVLAVALVWRGAGRLRQADPPSFEIAEDVLLTAASQLSTGSYGAKVGQRIRVFFERV